MYFTTIHMTILFYLDLLKQVLKVIPLSYSILYKSALTLAFVVAEG